MHRTKEAPGFREELADRGGLELSKEASTVDTAKMQDEVVKV
jgi:hypothetical protein